MNSSELSFLYQNETSKGRKAFRVSIPSLAVTIDGIGSLLQVLNLSVRGMALNIDVKMPKLKEKLSCGQAVFLDLIQDEQTVLSSLQAEIVRIEENRIACRLCNLSFQEELVLDKIVLEEQKNEINMQKLSQKKDSPKW